MNLFHQIYSRRLQFAADVLAALDGAKGHRLTMQAAYSLGARYGMDSILCDDVLRVMDEATSLTIENREICLTDKNGAVAPFATSALEEDYLQQILRLSYAPLFLSEDLQNKLQKPRKEEMKEIVRVMGPLQEGETPKMSYQEFRYILDAIEDCHAISYSYHTQFSKHTERSCTVPWRIEYSAYDNRWWVVLYSPEEKRCIKAWLSNLSDIHPQPQIKVNESEILEARKALLMPEPIVLHVKEGRNTLERCFMVMERQEFLGSKRNPDGSATLSFRYYRFDTKDILRQLLYLGDNVILVSPQSLRDALLEQVEKALAYFSESKTEQM